MAVVPCHLPHERLPKILVEIAEIVVGVAEADVAPIENAGHALVGAQHMIRAEVRMQDAGSAHGSLWLLDVAAKDLEQRSSLGGGKLSRDFLRVAAGFHRHAISILARENGSGRPRLHVVERTQE